jgi:hypothetical protein
MAGGQVLVSLGPLRLVGITLTKRVPCSPLYALQSSMPAFFAMAYGSLVDSTWPVSKYSSFIGCGHSRV